MSGHSSPTSDEVVLYFIHAKTSFTAIDEKIFSKYHVVKIFEFSISGVLSIPWLWIRQLFFILGNLKHAHSMVCMFAGYHSFLPVLLGKLLSKKVYIVAGGIDCVNFPKLNYGNFHKFWLAKITSFSFRNASHIFPISEYLEEGKYHYDSTHPTKQGIRVWCEGIKTPITVVYNGFQCEQWYPEPDQNPPFGTFLSIASNLDNDTRMKIKGIDLVLEVAALLPQYHFTIIGKDRPESSNNIPKNVSILPFMKHEELRAVYCRHQFYLQLSISEGFGNSLAEAMLCGSVPIGSSSGSIPMVIGNCGYILEQKNINELKKLIEYALVDIDFSRKQKEGRERIISSFSIEKREGKLKSLMKLEI
jgi:glycosyltransferase involved in cell wall biosynthesis